VLARQVLGGWTGVVHSLLASGPAWWQEARMSLFTDKVAVVTGAGRGIGLAIARRLAAEGAKVAVVSRTEANAAAAAAAINEVHAGAARAYAVDMADGEAVAAAARQITTDFGKVDILVNNAGVTRDGLTMRMSDDDWDVVLNTNLKGAFNAVKAFQRSLLRQKDARIINVASVIGLIGNAGQANYAASKGGLIALTKSLAKEFAGRGVTVNAIAPGFIRTDMTSVLNDAQREGILRQIPLGFMGESEDIAHAAAFLASPGARYVTGQVLVVDGGMVM
jgi:3-oxoacyl-[acyl-carrier protein] reductase